MKVLQYANSGDVTGERRQVVGYLSAAFFKDNPGGKAMAEEEVRHRQGACRRREAGASLGSHARPSRPSWRGRNRRPSKGQGTLDEKRGAFGLPEKAGPSAGLHRLHRGEEAPGADRRGNGRGRGVSGPPVRAGAERGTQGSEAGNLRPHPVAQGRGRGRDRGRHPRALHPQGQPRGPAPSPGGDGIRLGPGHVPEGDLPQGRACPRRLARPGNGNLSLFGRCVR
ncbi:MAG: hypothetical protein MZV70_34135 [Desulfobacterales bacterium]|nr:hypothetical protein [Desulfobacterales bacterium]